MSTQTVPVTQADREAAAELIDWQTSVSRQWNIEPLFVSGLGDAMRAGRWDDHWVVKAFARHRAGVRP